MKVVHVIPAVLEEAAGPSYSVPRLCESLADRGHLVELNCLAARADVRGVRLDVHPKLPLLDRFGVSISQAKALRLSADAVDVVHNHGLWTMGNVAAGLLVPGRRAKLVTSPRGMLSTWALSWHRTRKRALWPLQRRVLDRADLLHATSIREHADLRAQGFEAPVAVIPNGIDIPSPPTHAERPDEQTLLYLGRLHPSKGIDLLLKAWTALQLEHPGWQLVVAGTGEPRHERELHECAANIGARRVTFLGPVYGRHKHETYFRASLFVLPTHTENFGMTVAEALAHGCPAVVSRHAPWHGLEAQRCGWWVEQDLSALTAALDAAMSLPRHVLTEMGLRGRCWMEREFGWASVAREMEACYLWLLNGGTPPATVNLR